MAERRLALQRNLAASEAAARKAAEEVARLDERLTELLENDAARRWASRHS